MVTNLFEYHVTNSAGLNTFIALQFLHLNPKPNQQVKLRERMWSANHNLGSKILPIRV